MNEFVPSSHKNINPNLAYGKLIKVKHLYSLIISIKNLIQKEKVLMREAKISSI